jgi:Uma2 family endonuclease
MSTVLTPTAPTPGTPPAQVVNANPLGLPLRALRLGLRKFTVAEYDELVRAGVLGPNDRVELLEGYLVPKISHNPPHAGTIHLLVAVLSHVLPAGWVFRSQLPVVLSDSEPEPDGAIVRGDRRTYLTRHPVPADFGVVIEVASSSLDEDRVDQARIYAHAGLPEYWIVNLVDRQIEVYTNPQSAAAPPRYATRTDYRPGATVPLKLDGTTVAIRVDDLLP